MNSKIVAELRRQLANVSLAAVRSSAMSASKKAVVKVRTAELLLQLGNTDSARTVATEALDELGEGLTDGRGGEGGGGGGSAASSSLLRESKGGSLASTPSEHALACLSVLARVCENQKRHEEAVVLFRQCLNG